MARPMSETMRHGRRQTYLRPQNQSVKTNDAPDGLEAKKPSYPQANPSESIHPLPYRKKKDDGLVSSSSFPSFPATRQQCVTDCDGFDGLTDRKQQR